jgi:hypothetical protein
MCKGVVAVRVAASCSLLAGLESLVSIMYFHVTLEQERELVPNLYLHLQNMYYKLLMHMAHYVPSTQVVYSGTPFSPFSPPLSSVNLNPPAMGPHAALDPVVYWLL